MLKVSEAHERRAESSQRYRPPPDPIFLNAVAVRLAEIARLPLKVARQRVERLAISAGTGLDPRGATFTFNARRPSRGH